jgi:hypothetical protein
MTAIAVVTAVSVELDCDVTAGMCCIQLITYTSDQIGVNCLQSLLQRALTNDVECTIVDDSLMLVSW